MNLQKHQYPEYTQGEQLALHTRMQGGDAAAREQLILSLMPTALAAFRAIRIPLDTDARLHACVVAVIRAVDTWEPAKGALKAHACVKIESRTKTAARDCARESNRRRRAAEIAVLNYDRRESSSPVDEAIRAERIDLVRDAVASLDPVQRAAIAGRMAGMSNRETAKALGVTHPTVAADCIRAMRRMSYMLQGASSEN